MIAVMSLFAKKTINTDIRGGEAMLVKEYRKIDQGQCQHQKCATTYGRTAVVTAVFYLEI